MVCEDCGEREATPGKALCAECQNLWERAREAAWERQQEEGFRGKEAEAYQAEQQAWIQRNLK